jgi:hypothetical protein
LLVAAALAQGTQPAKEAPGDVTVIEAFSKQRAMCEGLTEWTLEANPEDWVNAGAKWVAIDEATAQANWSNISFVITIDGQEIANPKRFEHGPKPFSIDCAGEVAEGGAMALDIFLPPLPAGDHTIIWQYIIEADLNDGWDPYPAGTVAEYTGRIQVTPARLPETGAATGPSWVLIGLVLGGLALLAGLGLRLAR